MADSFRDLGLVKRTPSACDNYMKNETEKRTIVTFDQIGRKCNFVLLAANLPNWQFWRINGVFGRLNESGRLEYSGISNF